MASRTTSTSRSCARLVEAHRASLTAEQVAQYSALLDVPAAITTDLTTFTRDPAPIELRREEIARAIERLAQIGPLPSTRLLTHALTGGMFDSVIGPLQQCDSGGSKYVYAMLAPAVSRIECCWAGWRSRPVTSGRRMTQPTGARIDWPRIDWPHIDWPRIDWPASTGKVRICVVIAGKPADAVGHCRKPKSRPSRHGWRRRRRTSATSSS